jgi:hypothetical protein
MQHINKVMRLYEIEQTVAESVNFTRYIDDAENAMKKGILTACSILATVTITPAMQADITQTKAFGSVRQAVNLAGLIKDHCTVELKKLAVNKMKVPVTDVIFEPLGDSNGECYLLEVRLNIAYINGISNQVWSRWTKAVVANRAGDPFSYTKTAKKIINTFKKTLFEVPIPVIDNCASTFIHEMVHAQQHMPQLAKGVPDSGTDYGSYIKTKDVPDKKAFTKMVDTPGALDDPENYRIFRASPQEMAAFANQDAARFIKDNNLNVQGVTADPATMAKLQNYLGKYFRDRDNYQERTLLKRYGTLVYKAVDDYFSRKNSTKNPQ